MALTTDQLKNLSRLYDRWQIGDVAAREAVQREVDASGADVARAFASMFARTDGEASATLLPPIPKAMRDAAVLAVGESDAGAVSDARTARASAAPFSTTLSDAVDMPTRVPGQHVGPYRLIKELGRGGMGVVWLAERADGQHSRQVALKMPLVENLNWLLAARFARERNILASLEHPSIARLYDAGVDQTAQSTQPYIAIEYVQGLPITAYVRENKLKPEATVQLFTRVIEAVAHAHAQLVIHRDIKPSNILVDAKGEPHLLDFGIAKLLDDDDTMNADATQLTRLSGRALTLDYASPEQVNNAPLGVASDVYALGVVLYELLTGSRPYHPKGPTRRELEEAILEQEPTKPSDHLLGTGTSNSESGKSARRMRGDLDTIVLKALRKDPKLRYASAQAFADDLTRYLAYQPIQARPDGALYRLTKFIRRQRVPLVIAFVSCAAIAGLSWRAWQQQQVAQASSARAESIDGLMQSIFRGMSPDVATSRNFSAKELLDRARSHLDNDPKIDDASRRRARLRIAKLYAEVGANEQAVEIFARARSLARSEGDDQAEALALAQLADITTVLRQYDVAQSHIDALKTLLSTSKRTQGELPARLAIVEGQLAAFKDNPREARGRYGNAEALLVASKSDDYFLLGIAQQGQGHAARLLGELLAARERMGASMVSFGRSSSGGSVEQLASQSEIGELDNALGNFASALEILGKTVAANEARLGLGHAQTLGALRSLAFAQMRTGQFERTELTLAQLREAPDPYRAAERMYVDVLSAMMMMYRGDPAQAESTLARVLEKLPQETIGTARLRRLQGEMLLRANRTKEAAEVLSSAEKLQVRLLGASHPDVAMTRVLVACAATRTGELNGARATLQSAVPVLLRERGAQHPTSLVASAYDALLKTTTGTPPSAAVLELAGRVDRELGWQQGAAELATWLRSADAARNWQQLPIVF